MSGRVRWRPFTGEPDRARMLVVGRMRVGDVVPVGDGWDATVYGTDERETFTRRRAATRWLLARAAGLAEVPRRVRPFAMWARGTEGGRGYRIEAGALVPRGWRRAGARGAIALLADGTTTRVDHVERNRRRR